MPTHDEGILQTVAVYEGERDPVSLSITQVEPVMVDRFNTAPLCWQLMGDGGGGEWRVRV